MHPDEVARRILTGVHENRLYVFTHSNARASLKARHDRIMADFDAIAEGFGALCLGHPATCDIFAQLAASSGASVLRGTGDISVTSGSRPIVNCEYDGASLKFRPRLVIGADGRNSSARKKLGFKVNADQPRNLLGGMLVKGVPSWPRDTQVIGVEGRFHFLVFPRGDDLLRLYGSYHFADKSRFDGPDRRAEAFLPETIEKLLAS